jgi:hypothetical protein
VYRTLTVPAISSEVDFGGQHSELELWHVTVELRYIFMSTSGGIPVECVSCGNFSL